MFKVKKYLLLVVLIQIGLMHDFDNVAFGFGDNFEPDDIKFLLQEGKEFDFNLEIEEECAYEVGVKFESKEGDTKEMDRIFGRMPKLDLPARFSIKMNGADSHTVLDKKSFGGKKIGYRHGGPRIKFIAKNVRLFPGVYTVKIKVVEIEESFDGVESYFFVNYIPKSLCN